MPRIIITEPDIKPQPYRLKTDRISTKIGRASDNDIIITTGSASTYHCKMKRIEGGFVLVDNNSTNGIKHDDTRYSVIDLKDGMTVQIGDDIDMEFTLSEDELDILEQEDFEPQQKASFPKKKKKPESIIEPPKEDDDDDAVVLEGAKTKDKSSSDDADTSKPQLKRNPKLKTDTDK
ncbi:MAG: pSer/pThr/pTyr-binding forkhead associated (FHA) protein, partial [Cryomorphaceae bacterium]